jgi:CheB methylesterase
MTRARVGRRTARLKTTHGETDRRGDSRATGSFPIVGIGASVGGLEAFSTLLKHLPLDTGMGFVLVQHLDPVHDSALTQLLGRATSLPVQEVTNNLRVEPNHVYVIPPNTNLSLTGGVLTLGPRPKTRTPHRSIDFFFEALANDQRDRAIGVILSGTATDGTVGLEAIRQRAALPSRRTNRRDTTRCHVVRWPRAPWTSWADRIPSLHPMSRCPFRNGFEDQRVAIPSSNSAIAGLRDHSLGWSHGLGCAICTASLTMAGEAVPRQKAAAVKRRYVSLSLRLRATSVPLAERTGVGSRRLRGG